MNRKIFSLILTLFMAFGLLNYASAAQQEIQKPAITVNPLTVVSHPQKYLNNNIKMDVVFDKFTSLGLDYPKAMRSSDNYIGFTIQRNDVSDHNIPLSEMKLFLKREYAEKFAELDTGDKLEITGKLFSTALGDPWVDINNIVIKEKAKKETK